jgi:hypothetical protein
MINGKPQLLGTAIGTLEPVPDKNILFAESNPGTIKGADKFDQAHNSRDFENSAAGASHRLGRILQHLNLALCLKAHSPFPMNHIEIRVICIQ